MALIIDSLRKRFGSIVALDGISFRVEPGQVFGFLGANGAGKTTAFRIILDIIRADAGTVTWKDVGSQQLPRRTWGYLPEERGLYPRMTVMDQLLFFGQLHGVPAAAARHEVEEWLERFRIPEYRDRKVESLSKGNQQKIQFLAAILHDPDVLLMDEPFTGLDPVNATLLKEAFLEMRDRGKTLVFSTHQMDTVEELCDAVAIIDRGQLVANGPTREVRRSGGRRIVLLGVEGDPSLPWLVEMEGVQVRKPGRDYTELEVEASRDPMSVLQAALTRGERITRFEIADPSLEQIFVERVGRSARGEEQTLAEAPRATPA
ncbi:MAG: ATP-binding cassette domain-containing protein [Chloroflexi bacterium]|nr:ATP-binding cassette domain-containing protein [Chloroflexota bacterium]